LIWYLIVPYIFRNTWRNNYWDDWKLPIPRPIRGEWSFFIVPLMEILGPFPTFQVDWSPEVIPYDIEVS